MKPVAVHFGAPLTVAFLLRVACNCIFLLLLCGPVVGAGLLSISGEYETERFQYNTSTYRRELHAAFEAILAGQAWRISATNVDNQAEWEVLEYNGIEMYNLTPTTRVRWRNLPEQGRIIFGSVSASPGYIGLVQTGVEIYVPWLAYGVSSLGSNYLSQGVCSLPLPWGLPRRYLSAYGYRWQITPSPDGRFISKCDFVRDPVLDLVDEKSEFLRPTFDYPDRIEQYLEQVRMLNDRKAVPSGYVAASYSCIAWHETNGLRIPSGVELTRYHRQNDGSSLAFFRTKLKARRIRAVEGELALGTHPEAPVHLQDYRYRRASDDRAFLFADYTLSPSEPWKTGSDPSLSALAQDQLRNTRRYDDFGLSGWWHGVPSTTKRTLKWVILAVLQVPIVIYIILWRTKHRVRKT